MKILFALLTLLGLSSVRLSAQESYAREMATSQGKQWTHGKDWDYVNGLVARSLLDYCEAHHYDASTTEFYQWAKDYADRALHADGTFKAYKKGNIDNVNSGKVLLGLYKRERELDLKNGTHHADKYRQAADFLRHYLVYEHPRIQEGPAKGGFYHKDIYPEQMWLDGLYMGATYYAQWQGLFAAEDREAWSDIARQFLTVNRFTYDPAFGLNYHAWANNPDDANAFWANSAAPFIGCSKEFWGRGMGWYFAGLVDVLEVMPSNHPDYEKVKAICLQVAEGLAKWQDKKTGAWYQLLRYDHTFKSKCGIHNYLESSASSMFTYAYLKGLRLGILPSTYESVATRAYRGLIKQFVSRNPDGSLNLNQTCRSAGLGPAKDPSRDGSADYYLCGSDVTMVSNEGKAIGPFIMAAVEYEMRK